MAASQRPGFTGRSQTPPAQKPLVRTFKKKKQSHFFSHLRQTLVFALFFFLEYFIANIYSRHLY